MLQVHDKKQWIWISKLFISKKCQLPLIQNASAIFCISLNSIFFRQNKFQTVLKKFQKHSSFDCHKVRSCWEEDMKLQIIFLIFVTFGDVTIALEDEDAFRNGSSRLEIKKRRREGSSINDVTQLLITHHKHFISRPDTETLTPSH